MEIVDYDEGGFTFILSKVIMGLLKILEGKIIL